MFGLGGDDTLNGGDGFDTLFGQGGNDTFVFETNFGQDIVQDFSADDDEDIVLSFTNILDFSDLTTNHLQTDAGSGFALIVDGANSILLNGVSTAQIGSGLLYSENDFEFLTLI